ncbi:unnamed protein product [Auanema sp. JU1783]|nr:unnamed protein product [Auanema sp. JU1783]
MYDVLLYFALNALGFFFFLFIYNRFPKVRPNRIWNNLFPRPDDYTTIPGLKLSLPAEELPPLTIEPGQTLCNISATAGHLSEIKRFPNFRQFLEYCSLCYGPLSSFYWGPRYVVSVSSPKIVEELAKYKENLVTVCPLTIGSALSGDMRTWSENVWTPNKDISVDDTVKFDKILSEKTQNKICLTGPFKLTEEQTNRESDPIDLIKQLPAIYGEELKTSKSIREILSRPLVVIFNLEIDVDAHPIPKYIPIIIHVGGLVQRWSTEEIWDSYMKTLDWVPGIELLHSIDEEVERKIRRETVRRR